MTHVHTVPAVDRRMHLLALMVGVPAIISALGVSAFETWRLTSPGSPLFSPPAAASMADAIARNDARGAYAFIRAGQDPNAVIVVRHDVLTGGQRVEVVPLLWAVATQSQNGVAMLLAFGGRLDAPMKHQAVCLATQLGRDDIVQLLQLSGPDVSPEACPAVRAADEGVPLLPIP